MLKKSIFFILMAMLVLTACAPAATPEFYTDSGGRSAGAPPPAATAAPVQAAAPDFAGDAVNATTAERLVIMNASLSLVVKDPAAAVDQISAMAQTLRGFVVASNVYQASTDAEGNKIMRASVSIRIPAEKLTDTLARLEAMDVDGKAESKNVSGEDVTALYTDLESRLRNLEAAEQQLQNIMDGATKTEDVLAVYNQLVYIREQIEQVKGQMKYYSEAAALSLITIDLIPDALSQPIEVGGWQPQGIAKDALEALVRTLQGLGTLLIWGGVYVLPLGLLCAIPVGGGVWLVRRFLRNRKPRAALAG
jgi:hypothetical protein